MGGEGDDTEPSNNNNKEIGYNKDSTGPTLMPKPIPVKSVPEFDYSKQNIDSAFATAAASEAFINKRVNTIDAATEDDTRIFFYRENNQYDHYDERSDFIEKKSAYDYYDKKSDVIEKDSAVNDPITLIPEPVPVKPVPAKPISVELVFVEPIPDFKSSGVNNPATLNLVISFETSSPTLQEFKTHKDGSAQAPRRR